MILNHFALKSNLPILSRNVSKPISSPELPGTYLNLCIGLFSYSAHDIAAARQHRSVSASDVMKALELIQFGDMVDGIQEELKGTLYILWRCFGLVLELTSSRPLSL